MEEELPVYKIRADFARIMAQSNQAIIFAPTGSGKSTLIPQFLVDDVLQPGKMVVVLQPRRIAARLLANFIAGERNGFIGKEVGYQVRLENKQSSETKILFVTEGILLNRLLKSDELDHVGAIVFDEFHERHLETDLSLALSLKLQEQKRNDLKIVVMSATLELSKVKSILGNAATLESEGRRFPVDIRYFQPKPIETVWDSAANSLESVIDDFKTGSALVFMPGVFEIRKTIDAIKNKPRLQSFEVYPLYSSLTPSEQDAAVRPGGRKIIVTTNVAETSITIPGITLVIDSGLARISRFDPKRGINTLFSEPVSKASANQRTGRAGRVAPGISVRLWSEFSHEHRTESTPPEIHRVDLSEAILGLIAAGENPGEFAWIEAPAKASLDNSLGLLRQLNAIDQPGNLTILGAKMAAMHVHPRLARMLAEAEKENCLAPAALLAAIVQSSGFMYGLNDEVLKQERLNLFGHVGSDLIFELNAWLWAGLHQFRGSECSLYGINVSKARDIGKLALQILHNVSVKSHSLPKEKLDFETSYKLRKCIFAGFADYLAIRHRPNSPTCQMMFGRSGQLHRDSSVQDAKFMVVNEMEETKSPTGIQTFLRKVTEIEPEWLTQDFLSDIQEIVSYSFNKELNRAVKTTEYLANQLVLRREQTEIEDDDTAAQVIARAIHEGEIPFPQWDEEVEHYVRRLNFAARHASHYGIPAIGEEEKDFIIQQAVYKCRSLKDIQKCRVWPSLKSWLSYEQSEAVNVVAPETIMLPHKKRSVKLRYDEKGDVILSETIQALYDCPLPLTVAEGKVPVIFELLAPSRRPVQITRDLEKFWKNSYLEIKKELKGRYPKHEWR